MTIIGTMGYMSAVAGIQVHSVKVDIVTCVHLDEGELTRYTLFLGRNDKQTKMLSVCQCCWGNLLSKGYENFADKIGKSMSKATAETAFAHHD